MTKTKTQTKLIAGAAVLLLCAALFAGAAAAAAGDAQPDRDYTWDSITTTLTMLTNLGADLTNYPAAHGVAGITNIIVGKDVTSIAATSFTAETSTLGTLAGITISTEATSTIGTAVNTLLTDQGSATVVIQPINDMIINASLFENATNLKAVELRSGVKEIGSSAFKGTGLTTVEIPGSVKTIGASAFGGSALTTVTLNEGLQTIGNSAFKDCSGTFFAINNGNTFPVTVYEIGANAFEGTKLSGTVTIENRAGTIGSSAFAGTDITNLVLGDGKSYVETTFDEHMVMTIGDNAFENCTSLVDVKMPHNVTSIGASAFSGCTSLKTIALSNKLTEIAASTFNGCASLESISLPSSVQKIGDNAFMGSGLTSFNSNSVQTIGANAFKNCSSLETLVLGDQLIATEWTPSVSTAAIGAEAFASCTGLTGVYIGKGITKTEFEGAFSESGYNNVAKAQADSLAFGHEYTTDATLHAYLVTKFPSLLPENTFLVGINEKTGGTEVTYGVGERYILTIPSDLEFAGKGVPVGGKEVKITDDFIEPTHSILVEMGSKNFKQGKEKKEANVNNELFLKYAGASATPEKTDFTRYQIHKFDQSGVSATPVVVDEDGKAYLIVIAGSASGYHPVEKIGGASLTPTAKIVPLQFTLQEDPAKAGSHQDLLTFISGIYNMALD